MQHRSPPHELRVNATRGSDSGPSPIAIPPSPAMYGGTTGTASSGGAPSSATPTSTHSLHTPSTPNILSIGAGGSGRHEMAPHHQQHAVDRLATIGPSVTSSLANTPNLSSTAAPSSNTLSIAQLQASPSRVSSGSILGAYGGNASSHHSGLHITTGGDSSPVQSPRRVSIANTPGMSGMTSLTSTPSLSLMSPRKPTSSPVSTFKLANFCLAYLSTPCPQRQEAAYSLTMDRSSWLVTCVGLEGKDAPKDKDTTVGASHYARHVGAIHTVSSDSTDSRRIMITFRDASRPGGIAHVMMKLYALATHEARMIIELLQTMIEEYSHRNPLPSPVLCDSSAVDREILDTDIIWCGRVQKKGKMSWAPRWLVLKKFHLRIYKTGKLQVASNSVSLSGAKVAPVEEKDRHLTLTCVDRSYTFKASDIIERDNILWLFQKAMEISTRPTQQGGNQPLASPTMSLTNSLNAAAAFPYAVPHHSAGGVIGREPSMSVSIMPPGHAALHHHDEHQRASSFHTLPGFESSPGPHRESGSAAGGSGGILGNGQQTDAAMGASNGGGPQRIRKLPSARRSTAPHDWNTWSHEVRGSAASISSNNNLSVPGGSGTGGSSSGGYALTPSAAGGGGSSAGGGDRSARSGNASSQQQQQQQESNSVDSVPDLPTMSLTGAVVKRRKSRRTISRDFQSILCKPTHALAIDEATSFSSSSSVPSSKIEFAEFDISDPSSSFQRPSRNMYTGVYGYLKLLCDSMTSGAHLTSTLYVPKTVWYQNGAKFQAFHVKLEVLETIRIQLCTILPPSAVSDSSIPVGDELERALTGFRIVAEEAQNKLAQSLSFIHTVKEPYKKQAKAQANSSSTNSSNLVSGANSGAFGSGGGGGHHHSYTMWGRDSTPASSMSNLHVHNHHHITSSVSVSGMGNTDSAPLSLSEKLSKSMKTFGKIVSRAASSTKDKVDHEDSTRYVRLLNAVFEHAQVFREWQLYIETHNSQMSSTTAAPSPTNSARPTAASLAEFHSHKSQIEEQLRWISEFMYSVLCNMVIRDLKSVLKRYIKHCVRTLIAH